MDDRGIVVRFGAGARNSSFLQTRQTASGPLSLLFSGSWRIPYARNKPASGMKPTTDIHLAPRLRMRGVIPPIPHMPSGLTEGQLYRVLIRP